MTEGQAAASGHKQDDFSLQIRGLYTGPPPEGDVGQGLLFHTDRGDISAFKHCLVNCCVRTSFVKIHGPARLCTKSRS